MNEEAAKHLGHGLAWFGFWLMIGLANFGEDPACNFVKNTIGVEHATQAQTQD